MHRQAKHIMHVSRILSRIGISKSIDHYAGKIGQNDHVVVRGGSCELMNSHDPPYVLN